MPVRSGETSQADFAMRPIDPQTGGIFGLVIDARTLEPLEGVQVWVLPDGDVVIADIAPAVIYGWALTDENGQYEIDGIPVGPVRVMDWVKLRVWLPPTSALKQAMASLSSAVSEISRGDWLQS